MKNYVNQDQTAYIETFNEEIKPPKRFNSAPDFILPRRDNECVYSQYNTKLLLDVLKSLKDNDRVVFEMVKENNGIGNVLTIWVLDGKKETRACIAPYIFDNSSSFAELKKKYWEKRATDINKESEANVKQD